MADPASLPMTVVVAAVLSDDRGRILIARRPHGVHMAGLWEFPGGKLHTGESMQVGLARELAEEIGVTAGIGELLDVAVHEDAESRVLLLFFSAKILRGTARPLEGQELRWVDPGELPGFPSPPADAPLIADLAAGRYTLVP